MKKRLIFWGEKYLFSPGIFEWLLSFLLLPLSLIYCLVVWIKYKTAVAADYGLPIVSIGNLIVGGSGKTPLTVALAKGFEKRIAVVLRGYGRLSKGLYVVSDGDKILCDVACSGDEAMLYATLLPEAVVIVSENRAEGIRKAKSMDVKVVFLDDAYSKHHIKKMDLLIVSKQKNPFCLPSGPYRERLWSDKEAFQVKEDEDFKRKVEFCDATDSMTLVTAISKPQRLDPYLDARVKEKIYFPDHYNFNKQELEDILRLTQSKSLLVTRKDAVKLQGFELPLSYLELELEVDERIHQKIQEYAKITSLK